MNITFCIGGAIGAALMPSWVLNMRSNFDVSVCCVLSPAAERFVSKQALSAISGQRALGDEEWISDCGVIHHKELAYWSDIILVSPASLNMMSDMNRLASFSLVLAIVAFSSAPVLIVPAVSGPVVNKPAYTILLESLRNKSMTIIEPSDPIGSIALSGFNKEKGGMATYEDLMKKLRNHI